MGKSKADSILAAILSGSGACGDKKRSATVDGDGGQPKPKSRKKAEAPAPMDTAAGTINIDSVRTAMATRLQSLTARANAQTTTLTASLKEAADSIVELAYQHHR